MPKIRNAGKGGSNIDIKEEIMEEQVIIPEENLYTRHIRRMEEAGMSMIGSTPSIATGSKVTPFTGPPGLSDAICVRIDGLGLGPIIIHGRTADPISTMAHLTPSEVSKEEEVGGKIENEDDKEEEGGENIEDEDDDEYEYEQINCMDEVLSEDDMISDLAKINKFGLNDSPFPMSNPIAKIKKNKSARKAARKAAIIDDVNIFQEVIDL